MILNLKDSKIKELKKGEFAIPCLIWNKKLQELVGYKFTIKARTLGW